MKSVKNYFHNFLFEQLEAHYRVSILRFLVVIICLIMLFLGPYDTYYHINFAEIMFQARFPFSFFLSLGEGFKWIKFLAIGTGFCALLGYRTRWTLPLFSFFYCILNYYIHCFQENYGLNQAHLNMALIILSCVPTANTLSIDILRNKEIITQSKYESCSFVLTFLGGYVAVLFFQAGISKLIYSGIDWYLTGDTIYVETILEGTAFGRYLTKFRWIFPFLGVIVGLFEIIIPFLYTFSRFHTLLGYMLLLFHLCTFLIMGISFWFLWPLYIPLYIMPFQYRNLLRCRNIR